LKQQVSQKKKQGWKIVDGDFGFRINRDSFDMHS